MSDTRLESVLDGSVWVRGYIKWALLFYVSLQYLFFQADGSTFCSGDGTTVDGSATLRNASGFGSPEILVTFF